MADPDSWAFPERLQPHQDRLHFDLQSALQSVVLLRAEIPDEAFTASVLGTERVGHGVVIGNDGLVVTIGYLITEASSIWLTTRAGAVVPGHALAYDHVTGFGLVLPLGNLAVPPMERGASASVGVGDSVTVIGHGGQEHALETRIVARREFAGYWEYLLDEALFTSPAHPHWAGTALVGEDGRLLGIGSLLVQERVESLSTDANMFVPIDLLEPILVDMLRLGKPNRPPRPWLGVYATQMHGLVIVGGLTQAGPAWRAGVRPGDVLSAVAGEPVADLAELFRKVWSQGPAGSEINLTLVRGGTSKDVRVTSADRNDFLTRPRRH